MGWRLGSHGCTCLSETKVREALPKWCYINIFKSQKLRINMIYEEWDKENWKSQIQRRTTVSPIHPSTLCSSLYNSPAETFLFVTERINRPLTLVSDLFFSPLTLLPQKHVLNHFLFPIYFRCLFFFFFFDFDFLFFLNSNFFGGSRSQATAPISERSLSLRLSCISSQVIYSSFSSGFELSRSFFDSVWAVD